MSESLLVFLNLYFDPSGRLEDELIFEILQDKLNSKPCRNQGYVLDGYLKTYNQAKLIFHKGKFHPLNWIHAFWILFFHPNVCGVLLLCRWGPRGTGNEDERTSLQQEHLSRLENYFFNSPWTDRSCMLLSEPTHLNYIIQLVFRVCYCLGGDGRFPDTKSSRTPGKRRREDAMHPGRVPPSPEEIPTTQYCWREAAGLLRWDWDLPRTNRYCPQSLIVQKE